MNQIPERLVNFRAYFPGGELIGATDVELPNLEVQTENIAGAGIAGEYASPVLGHFASLMVKLKMRSVSKEAIGLIAPVRQAFDIRGSMQVQDAGLGTLLTQAIRVECTGQTKAMNLGKFEPGKPMSAEIDLECSVLRISIDNVSYIEIDKFNMVCKINGFDFLAKARIDMGGV